MMKFEGEITHGFDVEIPEAIWEMVSSEEWQQKFYTFESIENFVKWLAYYPEGSDFSRIDGFYGVEEAKDIKIKYWKTEVEID